MSNNFPYLTEPSRFLYSGKHFSHLLKALSKHKKKSRNAKGSAKAVIVKVNGKNVYSSFGGVQNTTNPPTPPFPTTTTAPQTHNINLHINVTKSNPPEKEESRPVIIAAAQPQPQPQQIVAVVPQATQPAQIQAQAQIVPQILPIVTPAPATSAPEKKESSLNKLLLTAALLKGLGGDSTEGNSQTFPPLLTNLMPPYASPFRSLLPAAMGYPQPGVPQGGTSLGYPALGNVPFGYRPTADH